MRKNEKGFGIIEVILVLAIVALIAATGLIVFDRQKKESQYSQQQQETTKAEVNPNKCGEATQSYLTVSVKDGFKIPLSDDICDAYFVPNTSSDKADQGAIGFKSIDNIAGCRAKVQDEALGSGRLTDGAIGIDYDYYDNARVVPGYSNNTTTSGFASYPDSFKIGDNYFRLRAKCKSSDTQEQQLITNLQNALIDASKNAINL